MLSRAEQRTLFPSDYPQNYYDYPWEHYEERRGFYGVFFVQLYRDTFEEASVKSGFDPKTVIDGLAFFSAGVQRTNDRGTSGMHGHPHAVFFRRRPSTGNELSR